MKEFNFVYVTTNLVNGKQYVGDHSTNSLEDGYLGSGNLFTEKLNEYGKRNFKREISEFFDSKQEAFDAQEKYIRLHKTHVSEGGYNISWKGGHNVKDCISDETKEKLSKASKGIPKTSLHKQNISNTNSGQIPWNKGKKGLQKHSNETKERLSKKHTGKKMSEESKNKNKNKHLKENLSIETLNKMRDSAKKRWQKKNN